MHKQNTTTERLGTFSDGVIAVIITIMVLELKAPEQATFQALLPLWPTVPSRFQGELTARRCPVASWETGRRAHFFSGELAA